MWCVHNLSARGTSQRRNARQKWVYRQTSVTDQAHFQADLSEQVSWRDSGLPSAGKTCREAGAIVSCRTGLRDMNMAASVHNDKASEVLATGLSDDRTRSSVDGAVHQSA